MFEENNTKNQMFYRYVIAQNITVLLHMGTGLIIRGAKQNSLIIAVLVSHPLPVSGSRNAHLDLEDLLEVGDAEGLLERGDGAVGVALDVGVDGLDGDALLDESEALADGPNDLGRKTTLDERHELLGEGLVKSSLDLFISVNLPSRS